MSIVVAAPTAMPPAAALAAAATTVADAENVSAAAVGPAATRAHAVPIEVAIAGGMGGAGELDVALRPATPTYRAPESRTELTDRRTEKSRTFANPDGTFTLETSAGRLNYRDADGQWQPMDLSLVETDDPVFGLQVKANDSTVAFGTVTGAAGMATMTAQDGTMLSLRALGGGLAAPGATNVSFEGVGQAPAVAVFPVDTGFEYRATWTDAKADAFVDFALDPHGAKVSLADDGGIVLHDAAGAVVGQISAPLVYQGDPDAGAAAVDAAVVSVTELPDGDLPGETVLRYELDPKWLSDPARQFPIVLDPTTYCLGEGCAAPYNTGNLDHFVYSGNMDSYPVGWTTMRVGYDVRTGECNPECVMASMRGLVFFKSVALPDGAIITDTDLDLFVCCNYGNGQGQQVNAVRIVDGDGWNQQETWHKFGTGTGTGGNGDGFTTIGKVYSTVPAAGNHQHWDVDEIVRTWYTRRGPDWQANLGFAVYMNHEGSPYGEVEYRRYNYATLAYRPKLSITFEEPNVAIDFAPELGPNYAPSQMVAGSTVNLPIVVTNAGSGFSFDTTNWKVGYRWFDARGNLASSGSQALPAPIASGLFSATIPLSVSVPSTAGQYTLRLDLIRNGTDPTATLSASDWATPTKYYARNKKLLSSDNTRWVGSSDIERDEFSISVVPAGGTSGDGRLVGTGDGGSLAVDLATGRLTYAGAGGVGFADRLPTILSYGYDSGLGADCTGILAACAWFTNWDERFVAGTAAGEYTYQSASGARSQLSSDGDGQIVGGPGALLARPRATIWDEAGQNTGGNYLVAASGEPFVTAFAGLNVLEVPSNASTWVGPSGFQPLDLNTYRTAKFAVRTTSAPSAGIDFKIHNATDSSKPDRWFIYTVGTNWTTGFSQVALNGTINGGTWTFYSDNLWDRIKSNPDFGAPTDTYQVISVQIQSASGSYSGSTYVDAWRLEPTDYNPLADANPAWTSNGTNTGTVTSDKAVGTSSIKIPSNPLAASPDCLNTGCVSTANLGVYTFESWWWKKLGGQTAALTFHVKDTRTGAPCNASACDLTYYAGAAAPAGASDGGVTKVAIQVADVAPLTWTKVTRNLLRDAQQAFGLYNDGSTADPAAPPASGPVPDMVEATGYRPSGVDGGYLLIDDLHYSSVPDIELAEWSHPSSQQDPYNGGFTYDFTAKFNDGSTHYYNQHGLLERISDRDGNKIELDYTITRNVAGAAAYRLDLIHSPTDGSTGGGATYRRQIGVSYSGSAPEPRLVTFTELLGTSAGGGGLVTGRATAFTVQTVDSTSYTNGDVTRIKPARTPSCAGSGASGCDDFSYTSADLHQLQYAYDPRSDGSNNYNLNVVWTANAATAIRDGAQSNTELLKVHSFNVTGQTLGPASKRVLYQDASDRRSNTATYVDLTSDGRELYRYIPLTCGADCLTMAAATTAQLAVSHEFDGLARVNSTTTFRCPGVSISGTACTGTTPERLVARTASKAAAKVDNVSDPLTAGLVAWTQSPDQVVASLRDSAGDNPALYRTAYTYNGAGQVTGTTELAYNARPDYANTLKGTTASANLKGYWRLDEASGPTAVDSAATPHNGTYVSFSAGDYAKAGALVNDAANKAAWFDVVDNAVTVPSTFGTVTGSFTVELWIRPDADTTSLSIPFGTRTGAEKSFDIELCKNNATYCDRTSTLRINVGNGTSWLLNTNTSLPFAWNAGQWYQIAVVVDDAADMLTAYVDGEVLGGLGFTTAGTPLLTDATRTIEIGNNGGLSGGAGFLYKGRVDDVAVWNTTLSANQIADHYLAGRSVAARTTETFYDAEGHPLQLDDQFLASPGFESSTVGWAATGGTWYQTDPANPIMTYIHSGYASYSTGSTGTVQQDVQLVPGQTFRFQTWYRTTGAAVPKVTASYWQRSSAAWVAFPGFPATAASSSSFVSLAWDLSLPFDADGRVRVNLTNNIASDAVYFDDVALLTSYARSEFAGDGRLIDAYTFAFGGTAAEIRAHLDYGVDTGSSSPANAHPGIWPTTTTSNYVDGTFDLAYPDQDVSSLTSYDGWGHKLTLTDADGVATSAAYAQTGNGAFTDVVASSVGAIADGNGVAKTLTHDLVGNVTSATDELDRTTTSTYDRANHLTSTLGPDGRRDTTAYDTYGFPTSSIANNVDGSPSGAAGLDDVTTMYAYDVLGYRTQTDVDTGYTGALAARTITLSDLTGAAVSSTAYPGSAGTGTARTTSQRFARYTLNGNVYIASAPTGIRNPIAPAGAPAPDCGDGSGSYCNVVTSLDPNGRPIAAVDANGKTTRTFNDLAGRPVIVIANYADGVYSAGAPDTDVIAVTQFGLNGQLAAAFDTLASSTRTTYDALARPVTVTTYDAAPTALAKTRTMYTPAGRIDRDSLAAAANTPDADLTWTKHVYDSAGHAIRTLAHYDISGNAQMLTEGFERGLVPAGVWDASSYLVAAGSTVAANEGDFAGPAALTGRGRLHVTTGSGANTGVAWDLATQSAGAVFKSGHTYRFYADVMSPSSATVHAFLGVDASGGDRADGGTFALTAGAWRSISFTWTPTADRTAGVDAVVRKDAGGAVELYVDNARVWDTGTAERDRNIPVETVYNAAGQAIATIAPPGDPAADRPLVSATATDPTGAPVMAVANATTAYSHAIAAEMGLVAYYPLDEPAGSTAEDAKASYDLAYSGAVRLGQAGAVDEARSSATFDGSTSQASGSSLTIGQSAYTIEAWVRADGSQTNRAIAGRWSSYLGAMLWIDGAGYYTLVHAATGTYLHSTTTPRTGQWDHVVGTWDGTTQKVYVNGSPVATASTTAVPGTGAAAFTIGRYSTANSLLGGIDEVAVYSAALSDTQVADHYAAGREASSSVARLTTRTTYDALGRTVDAWDAGSVRTHYGYNRLGSLTEATLNYIDGTASGPTGADDIRATYTYDVLGEMTDYCPATIVYAGTCGTAANAWHWAYDAAGHRSSETPAVNSGAGTTARDATVWTYNPAGQLASVASCPTTACATTDRHVDFEYDGVGRQAVAGLYQGAGTGTLALETVTWYRGDGRVTGLDYYEGAPLADTLTQTYDAYGNVDQVMRDTTVLTDFNWNADGTLAARADGDGGAIGVTSFGYDWAGRLTSATLPAAPSAWNGGVAAWTYRLDGTLATRSLPNGELVTYGYDAAGRLLSASLSSGTGQSLGRTLDRRGNVTSESRTFNAPTGDAGANTNSFSYDALGRVTAESGLASTDATKSYTYDHNFNRTQKVEGSTTYDYTYDQTDQLVTVLKTGGTSQTFSYDQYGNLTGNAESGVGVTTLAYDLGDKLTSITPAGGSATTFTYDALSRPRTRSVPGAGAETYSYVGTSKLVARIAVSGGPTTDAILDPAGGRLGALVGPSVGYYLADLHGSLAAVEAGSATTISAALRYDAYGLTVATYPTGGTDLSKHWKYEGRLDLSPTLTAPLYDFDARLYAPGLGAFNSIDSVIGAAADPRTMNRYLYAHANPATLVDPDGHYATLCDPGTAGCSDGGKVYVDPPPETPTEPQTTPTPQPTTVGTPAPACTPSPTYPPPGPLPPPAPADGSDLKCPVGVWGGSLLAAAGGEVAAAMVAGEGGLLVAGAGTVAVATGVGVVAIGLVGFAAGIWLMFWSCT